MTVIIRIFVFFALLPLSILSAQDEALGYLRLVNLVTAGEGKTEFFLNNQTIYAKGYTSGESTAAMGIERGSYTLKVKKTGNEEAEIELSLEEGPTQTIIAYSVPKRDKDGKIVKWNIQLEPYLGRKTKHSYEVACVSFLSTSEFTIGVQAGSEPVSEMILTPQKVQSFDAKKSQTYVTFRIKGKTFYRLGISDPGSYFVMIYQTPEGEVKAAHYYDSKNE